MAAQCPFLAMQKGVSDTPQKLNLKVLNPTKYLDDDLDYAAEFEKLDMNALKEDLATLMKTSQDWWPADHGHYGPLLVRLGWHSAGTYRTLDGRGGSNTGNMRFNPLDSWPDNGNLDKARRLLWPLKKKYGKKISWADLMIFAGTYAQEDMGLPTFGFAGGRRDIWATEEDVFWGTEESFMGLSKAANKLERPLGAIQAGLIYVNPEGPEGVPDPILAAGHIRETFGRMAMNDEETVALIAGGHTFGKSHGAAPPDQHVGPKPSEAPIEEQGFGWTSNYGTGVGKDAISSGLEATWTENPTTWDTGYFNTIFKYEWELYTGPGGGKQWRPKDGAGADSCPHSHEDKRIHPAIFTTDLALITDEKYLEISKKFHADHAYFTQAYAKAWYKLTHRDLGPVKRCLGSQVAPAQIWQDPITPPPAIPSADSIAKLKEAILAAAVQAPMMIRNAWASAATFRHTDFRGGANGARIRLAPQKDWPVNDPVGLGMFLPVYEQIQKDWNEANAGQEISMADLIVLAGCTAIESAAKQAGFEVEVPFKAGRGDATDEDTDADSFDVLEPTSDGFRNYKSNPYQLVDRAHMLTLTAPEMAVLVAGMRVLDANAPEAGKLGVLTTTPGVLDNSFFVNLCDMSVKWVKTGESVYEGKDRASGEVKWTATAVDLTFGSNAELRAIAEHYAMDDCKETFVKDFVKAWSKVMHLDLY